MKYSHTEESYIDDAKYEDYDPEYGEIVCSATCPDCGLGLLVTRSRGQTCDCGIKWSLDVSIVGRKDIYEDDGE